ncbi:nucleotide sugar dehydrogenase, partial [Tenacibaculum finnmarkense]|nr:nucleotide sugar dehydrogenase [Tenacibaculum finnmarkense]
VKHEYAIESVQELPKKQFSAIVLGVAHNEFKTLNLEAIRKETSIVYDVKGILESSDSKL